MDRSRSRKTVFRSSRRLARVRCAFGVGALLALTCCSHSPPPPNVLLITLDTTRADRLGCYGHAEAVTPALDELAASGIRFEHAFAQVPLTLASHASLLTGTFPRVNGVRVNAGSKLGDTLPTLAELLRAHGYHTGAFVASFVLDSVFGLDRGFDLYDDQMGEPEQSKRFESERRADQVADAALAWVGQDENRPFFAWVHFYDAHTPYEPPADFARRLADPYDAEIAFVDSQVRRLIDTLERSGLRRNTLVIVAGDHGEAFGEHGETEHGVFVYDTTVSVPLILSWPGHLPAGEIRSDEVQLVDVLPTVTELTGAGPDPECNGVSLLEVAKADDGEAGRTIYGESLYGQIGYGWAPLRYVVNDGWKYIEAPKAELYDLGGDPAERNNLINTRTDLAEALRRRLRTVESETVPIEAEAIDLDAGARSKLESLGYIVGSDVTTQDATTPADLPDPKDMAGVLRDHRRAVSLVRRARYAEAITLLEDVLRRSPGSLDVYEQLGWSYLSVGRPEDAERAYEKSLTRMPDHAERLWGLAESQRRQNKLEAAIANFRRALESRPTLGEAHMGLALAYSAMGDYPQAYEHARQHAEINPASKIAQLNVLNLAMELKRFDEASAAADRLVAIDPSDPDARLACAAAMRAAGRREEEIETLRAAHAAIPDDGRFTQLLAWVLGTTDDRSPQELDEALALARRGVEIDPKNPTSYDTLAAVLASRGSFAEATEAASRARALAGDPRLQALRSQIQARLSLYEAGRPYRE